MISEIRALGKRIYDLSNPREVHRYVVFCARCMLHYREVGDLIRYFHQDGLRTKILMNNPFVVEQMTRAFFYAGSSVHDREQLIETHYDCLVQKMAPEWAYKLGVFDGRYRVWESHATDDMDWYAWLTMEPGQRKEGLLSLDMRLGNEDLYQMMFWFGKDKNGACTLTIGAMQGPNMENARDVIKDITKRSRRYRTKNLILYMLQAVARGFGVKRIFAVSNDGYYAMNHLRANRKLKTDFGAFWEEAGGHITEDPRFYELPLTEHRKTMEEIPTRKRATYRKRFAFQDDVDKQIEESIAKIRK